MTGSVNDRGEGRFTRAKERFSQLAFLLKERDADNYLLWYFRDVSDLNKEGNFGYRIDNESYDIYFSLLSSYFVKARQLFVGKNLLARNDKTGFVDINTGEIVQVNKGSKWRCEELTLIELENIPVLVPFYLLTNEAGETIKLPLPPKSETKITRRSISSRKAAIFTTSGNFNSVRSNAESKRKPGKKSGNRKKRLSGRNVSANTDNNSAP